MTFYRYHTDHWSLPVLTDKPVPLTEALVRKSLRAIIDLQVESGENPFKEAQRMSDEFHNHQHNVPSVASADKEALLDWIMTTEEMQEALERLTGQKPAEISSHREGALTATKLNEEDWEFVSLTNLLTDLLVVESDSQ